MNRALIEKGVELILEGLGIDRDDPDFDNTPFRVANSFTEVCHGLEEDAPETISRMMSARFPSSYDEMIVTTGIDAVGICPHHLLPISYRASVAYLPGIEQGYVIGLSKMPRLVKLLAARPVLQEDLTKDIADVIESHLDPMGVGVVLEGMHGCMNYRGVNQKEALVRTSVLRGVFRNPAARSEFISLTNGDR